MASSDDDLLGVAAFLIGAALVVLAAMIAAMVISFAATVGAGWGIIEYIRAARGIVGPETPP